MKRNAAKSKKNNALYLAAALFCVALLAVRLIPGMYARYLTDGTGGDSAGVAAFVFDLQETSGEEYVKLGEIRRPGESQTVSITVKNHSGDVVSEVDEQYSITLKLNGSMPLEAVLAENGEEILPSVPEEAAQAMPVLYTWPKSGSFRFDAASKGSHTYTLTVEWPEAENDAKYASGSAVAEAVLTVDAIQANEEGTAYEG